MKTRKFWNVGLQIFIFSLNLVWNDPLAHAKIISVGGAIFKYSSCKGAIKKKVDANWSSACTNKNANWTKLVF